VLAFERLFILAKAPFSQFITFGIAFYPHAQFTKLPQ
jgi:hypothetical protein